MGDIEELKAKALAMPTEPGVYLMKDASGRVIYVGKAKILPRRVSSYFQKRPDSYKTGRLVALAEDLDYIVTKTEKEALILENSLIKKHRPKFNIILRDDKTFPSLRLTVTEEWPRLEVVRRIEKDGSVYFGPFTSASAMRKTIRLIRRLFPIRQCNRSDVQATRRPCLNHQLGRCLGPCHGHATHEQYRAVVDEIILFFQGKSRALADLLRQRMTEASARLDFETAARYRDRLSDVSRTLEKQNMVSADQKDRDVFGLARDRGQVLAVIMYVRRGAVLGSRTIPLGARTEPDREVVESLLGQYYGRDNLVPDEVLAPIRPEDDGLLEDLLREKKGRAVRVIQPVRGPKKKLLDLAAQNAATALAERLRSADLGRDALEELQRKLQLNAPPRRIEGYDMSHLQGEASVGAMVVLEEGHWIKSDYRRFRIKAAEGGDDYAMMSEVLGRRLEDEQPRRPDLILLDGGRGQLGVALAVIQDRAITDPPALAGLAKGRDGEPDRVFIPGRKNPVDLKADSRGLMLLMRVRDEAHRYVRTYHHRLRAKKTAHSLLDDIPGVGPSRRKALLDHFGSIDNIKAAGVEDLEKVKGVSPATARAIHLHFHPED